MTVQLAGEVPEKPGKQQKPEYRIFREAMMSEEHAGKACLIDDDLFYPDAHTLAISIKNTPPLRIADGKKVGDFFACVRSTRCADGSLTTAVYGGYKLSEAEKNKARGKKNE